MSIIWEKEVCFTIRARGSSEEALAKQFEALESRLWRKLPKKVLTTGHHKMTDDCYILHIERDTVL